MDKKFIKESFDTYLYAKENNIDPKNIDTWDNMYKLRMQKLAGIINEVGESINQIKKSN